MENLKAFPDAKNNDSGSQLAHSKPEAEPLAHGTSFTNSHIHGKLKFDPRHLRLEKRVVFIPVASVCFSTISRHV